MNRPVHVTAIDAVEALANALKCFQDDASAALDELTMEINRGLDWITNDRSRYWRDEVRRGYEQVAEAKVNLEQARMARRVAEHDPPCREERKILERAQQRLRTAEQKVEAVRHWSYAIERAVTEYQGSVGPLLRWLEADYPRALAALQRMSRSLESYVALQQPEESVTVEGTEWTAARGPGDAEPPVTQPEQPPPAAEEPEEDP